MATPAPSSCSLCCGCGSAGLSKGDRRSVNNSIHVLHTWKVFLGEISKNCDAYCGSELMMCRKCFSKYERYETIKKSIIDNLVQAMTIVPESEETTSASAAKRPKTGPISSLPAISSTSSSPDVAVSCFCL